jgi:hypothetical protein
MRSARSLLLLLLSLTGCSSADLLGPGVAQGIDGIALLGPQCPVQVPGNPCPDPPHQARIEIRSFGGGSVTSVQSGEDGRFRVGLRAGSYVLVPESGDPFPSASEQEVVVAVGVFTEVTVRFDTGIR